MRFSNVFFLIALLTNGGCMMKLAEAQAGSSEGLTSPGNEPTPSATPAYFIPGRGVVPIAEGGTSATDAATARLNLGIGEIGTFSRSDLQSFVQNSVGSGFTPVNFSGNLMGDVSGSQNATLVQTVGGVPASVLASTAFKVQTATTNPAPGTLVMRDGAGAFSATTITASLNGNAKSATTAGSAAVVTGNFSGDVSGTQSNLRIGDGVIVDNQVSQSANLQVGKLAAGPNGSVLTTKNGVPTWTTPNDFFVATLTTRTQLNGNTWQPIPQIRIPGVVLATGDVVRISLMGTYAILSALPGGVSLFRFTLNDQAIGPIQPVGAVAQAAPQWSQPLSLSFKVGNGATDVAPGTYEFKMEVYPSGSTGTEVVDLATPFTVGNSGLRFTVDVSH